MTDHLSYRDLYYAQCELTDVLSAKIDDMGTPMLQARIDELQKALALVNERLGTLQETLIFVKDGREAFEKPIRGVMGDLDRYADGDYKNMAIQCRWEVFSLGFKAGQLERIKP